MKRPLTRRRRRSRHPLPSSATRTCAHAKSHDPPRSLLRARRRDAPRAPRQAVDHRSIWFRLRLWQLFYRAPGTRIIKIQSPLCNAPQKPCIAPPIPPAPTHQHREPQMFHLVLSAVALAGSLVTAQPASMDGHAAEAAYPAQCAVSTPEQPPPPESLLPPCAPMPADTGEGTAPSGFGWG